MKEILVYTAYFPPGAPPVGHDCPDSMMTLAELLALPIFHSPPDRRDELAAYIAAMQQLIDQALELMALEPPPA